MTSRSYQDAIEHLNSLQSNAVTLDAVRASGGRLSEFAIPEMIEYLGRIGYRTEDLNALNVIHITGTKGKGSTSAFTDSIIRTVRPDWNVGLYTSPHLVAVRERIRINGAPISEPQFAKFFFEVWDKLEENDVRQFASTPAKPAYFRFVTLVAFHAFLSLKVDATILEVGVGGTYDSTNIVPKPIVTGVTALGIDHVGVLGKTLKEIAWQKGGIYKEGVPAFTINQPEEGLTMLKQQAKDLKASSFTVVPSIPELSKIKLGLAGAHQVQNANLAVHLAKSFLSTQASMQEDAILPEAYKQGLRNTRWPGRCQTVADPKHLNTTWFLDGAHTLESLECCIEWFVAPGIGISESIVSKETPRVLIFNCTSGRSGDAFLGSMLENIAAQLKLQQQRFSESSSTKLPNGGSVTRPLETPETFFDHVIFCTNVTYADGHSKGDLTAHNVHEADLLALKTQQQLASAWKTLIPSFPPASVHVLPSIEHAVNIVRNLETTSNNPVDVLVTGSLHLVGGMIEVAGLSDVAL